MYIRRKLNDKYYEAVKTGKQNHNPDIKCQSGQIIDCQFLPHPELEALNSLFFYEISF
jgi:hypothetical protein